MNAKISTFGAFGRGVAGGPTVSICPSEMKSARPPLDNGREETSLLTIRSRSYCVPWTMENATFRLERDTMGEMEVPAEALWGASTQRAVLNFPVSGERFDPDLIYAYGLIKWAAARADAALGVVAPNLAELIERAAAEVFSGEHDGHFVVDVFQSGSGTSTNMNANEVIANRCSILAREPLGSKRPVHSNDHVNQSQSSNDTFPAAMHVATALARKDSLIPSLEKTRDSLGGKAEAFHEVSKIGRTHLMDATPVRLGQEFAGDARQVDLAGVKFKGQTKFKSLRDRQITGIGRCKLPEKPILLT